MRFSHSAAAAYIYMDGKEGCSCAGTEREKERGERKIKDSTNMVTVAFYCPISNRRRRRIWFCTYIIIITRTYYIIIATVLPDKCYIINVRRRLFGQFVRFSSRIQSAYI